MSDSTLYTPYVACVCTNPTGKVYEGVDGAGSRGAWGMRGSGRRMGGGMGGDGGDKGRGHGAGRGGGNGDGDVGGVDFAEDEVRAAERLGVPVREVRTCKIHGELVRLLRVFFCCCWKKHLL